MGSPIVLAMGTLPEGVWPPHVRAFAETAVEAASEAAAKNETVEAPKSPAKTPAELELTEEDIDRDFLH